MSAPHILVDADACPVVRQVEQIARRYALPMTLLCDEHHVMCSDYAVVRYIASGADAVDIALMNLCRRGDVVVTQDYGVAAMVLGKGAYAIHHSGRQYNNDNIEMMLMERHMAQKARRASGKHHLRGPAKFTDDDRARFQAAFEALIRIAVEAQADISENTGGNLFDHY
ncbi:MAG: YaiI/YqxD family protein [Clostridia bacterium]|nr:YaiI/YqxD family protein [Clostridia bacterium]